MCEYFAITDLAQLYGERGASWVPVLWGPGFALLGGVVEGLTPGPANPMAWVWIGAVLAAFAAIWVYGRRRLCSVRLTASTLLVGGEELAVSRISELDDVEVPVGSHVLGGGAVAPRKTGEVPLRIDGDRVVIAWAKNPEALTTALRKCLSAQS